VIRGFRLKGFGVGKVFETNPVEITRSLPEEYQGAPMANRWELLRAEFQEQTRRYTFADIQSHETFSLDLPRGSDDLHFQAMRGRTGDVLIFASGDWKVGPPSFYGYVAVRKRPS